MQDLQQKRPIGIFPLFHKALIVAGVPAFAFLLLLFFLVGRIVCQTNAVPKNAVNVCMYVCANISLCAVCLERDETPLYLLFRRHFSFVQLSLLVVVLAVRSRCTSFTVRSLAVVPDASRNGMADGRAPFSMAAAAAAAGTAATGGRRVADVGHSRRLSSCRGEEQ